MSPASPVALLLVWFASAWRFARIAEVSGAEGAVAGAATAFKF